MTAPAAAQEVSTPPPADGRNLDDAEASFRFAAEAAAAGDIAGAIAALERVLQTNPDLANVKLELGLLYQRAGNFDLARSYLQEAVNAPDAPEAARQRARQALGAATGALGRFAATGSLFAGIQYQSNPNGSPASVSVTGPGGVPILISGDDLSIPRGADLSASGSASLQLRYGLNSQRGNDLVLDLIAAQTNYVNTTELDATFVNGRAGPRFFLGETANPSGFVRPFVSATALALGHARYFTAVGGGVDLFHRQALDNSITAQLAYERRDYDGSRRRPAADEQSGDYGSAVFEAARQLSPRLRASVTGLLEAVDARRRYWSRIAVGGQIGLAYAFAPQGGARSWFGRLIATYRRSDYRAPDPLVDPLVKRNDDRTEIEAGLTIPLGPTLGLDLRLTQTWNESNLPNYEYDNILGGIGISYRF